MPNIIKALTGRPAATIAGGVGLPFGMDYIQHDDVKVPVVDTVRDMVNGNFDKYRASNMVLNSLAGAGSGYMLRDAFRRAGGSVTMDGKKLLEGTTLAMLTPAKDLLMNFQGTPGKFNKALDSIPEMAGRNDEMADTLKSVSNKTNLVLGGLGLGALGLGGAALWKYLKKDDRKDSGGTIQYKLQGKKGDPESEAVVTLPIGAPGLSPKMIEGLNTGIRRGMGKTVKYNSFKRDPNTGKMIPYEQWKNLYGKKDGNEPAHAPNSKYDGPSASEQSEEEMNRNEIAKEAASWLVKAAGSKYRSGDKLTSEIATKLMNSPEGKRMSADEFSEEVRRRYAKKYNGGKAKIDKQAACDCGCGCGCCSDTVLKLVNKFDGIASTENVHTGVTSYTVPSHDLSHSGGSVGEAGSTTHVKSAAADTDPDKNLVNQPTGHEDSEKEDKADKKPAAGDSKAFTLGGAALGALLGTASGQGGPETLARGLAGGLSGALTGMGVDTLVNLNHAAKAQGRKTRNEFTIGGAALGAAGGLASGGGLPAALLLGAGGALGGVGIDAYRSSSDLAKTAADRSWSEGAGSVLTSIGSGAAGGIGGAALADSAGVNPLIGGALGTLAGAVLPNLAGKGLAAMAGPRTDEEQALHDSKPAFAEYVVPGYGSYQYDMRMKRKVSDSREQQDVAKSYLNTGSMPGGQSGIPSNMDRDDFDEGSQDDMEDELDKWASTAYDVKKKSTHFSKVAAPVTVRHSIGSAEAARLSSNKPANPVSNPKPQPGYTGADLKRDDEQARIQTDISMYGMARQRDPKTGKLMSIQETKAYQSGNNGTQQNQQPQARQNTAQPQTQQNQQQPQQAQQNAGQPYRINYNASQQQNTAQPQTQQTQPQQNQQQPQQNQAQPYSLNYNVPQQQRQQEQQMSSTGDMNSAKAEAQATMTQLEQKPRAEWTDAEAEQYWGADFDRRQAMYGVPAKPGEREAYVRQWMDRRATQQKERADYEQRNAAAMDAELAKNPAGGPIHSGFNYTANNQAGQGDKRYGVGQRAVGLNTGKVQRVDENGKLVTVNQTDATRDTKSLLGRIQSHQVGGNGPAGILNLDPSKPQYTSRQIGTGKLDSKEDYYAAMDDVAGRYGRDSELYKQLEGDLHARYSTLGADARGYTKGHDGFASNPELQKLFRQKGMYQGWIDAGNNASSKGPDSAMNVHLADYNRKLQGVDSQIRDLSTRYGISSADVERMWKEHVNGNGNRGPSHGQRQQSPAFRSWR